jgi:hypothetical protein
MNDILIKLKSEILFTLYEAKTERRVIGIYSTALSDQPCLTSVVNLNYDEDSDNVIVTLIGYDVNGHFYERDRINLEAIHSVVLFKSEFDNPFLRNLTNRENDNMRSFRL